MMFVHVMILAVSGSPGCRDEGLEEVWGPRWSCEEVAKRSENPCETRNVVQARCRLSCGLCDTSEESGGSAAVEPTRDTSVENVGGAAVDEKRDAGVESGRGARVKRTGGSSDDSGCHDNDQDLKVSLDVKDVSCASVLIQFPDLCKTRSDVPENCPLSCGLCDGCIPRAPVNGYRGTCPKRLARGASCVPSCYEGLRLEGETTCSADGVLSVAACREFTCKVNAVANGVLGACSRPLKAGRSCLPTCNPGYHPTGVTACGDAGVLASEATCEICQDDDASLKVSSGLPCDTNSFLCSCVASASKCTDPKYGPLIQKHCPKSCGLCDPTPCECWKFGGGCDTAEKHINADTHKPEEFFGADQQVCIVLDTAVCQRKMKSPRHPTWTHSLWLSSEPCDGEPNCSSRGSWNQQKLDWCCKNKNRGCSVCPEDKYRCKDDGRCIRLEAKCDLQMDCVDGNDEEDCKSCNLMHPKNGFISHSVDDPIGHCRSLVLERGMECVPSCHSPFSVVGKYVCSASGELVQKATCEDVRARDNTAV